MSCRKTNEVRLFRGIFSLHLFCDNSFCFFRQLEAQGFEALTEQTSTYYQIVALWDITPPGQDGKKQRIFKHFSKYQKIKSSTLLNP
jgi:hypothetical protein